MLAVIPLFHQRFHQFLFRWREKPTRDYAAKITLACILTGGPGYLLEKQGFKLPEQLSTDLTFDLLKRQIQVSQTRNTSL